MNLPVPWVSPEVVEKITEIAERELPKEACGIVTADLTVIQLPNRSKNPSNSYHVESDDLTIAIDGWLQETEIDPSGLTRKHFIIWHSHPSGVVGPSAGDLRERHEGFQYVVVSLPHGEVVTF